MLTLSDGLRCLSKLHLPVFPHRIKHVSLGGGERSTEVSITILRDHCCLCALLWELLVLTEGLTGKPVSPLTCPETEIVDTKVGSEVE